MDSAETAAAPQGGKAAQEDAKERAKRLYSLAVALEARSVDEICKEMARNVALLALDLLAEARAQ